MKRIITIVSSLLALGACATPTAPDHVEAAKKAADARQALQGASPDAARGAIAIN